MLIIYRNAQMARQAKRVNGGGTEGIEVHYGSHLSSVIINPLF